ncbi:hypothetical protein NMG60_11007863 [Bertholletia excelsa]
METPSSTRRVTRSQTLAASNNIHISRKMEDSEKSVSKSRPRTGNALIDITNDSPIVGLATGSLETPSLSKKRTGSQAKQAKTPGSGEALLRGQVKTLLQKVEEEAELSKLSLENRPFLRLQGLVNSPMGLLAPTPANTPQIPTLSDPETFKNCCLASVTPSPVQEQLSVSQMVAGMLDRTKQEGCDAEKSFITRSLLLDFSEKSEVSDPSECSSVLSNVMELGEEGEGKKKSLEDDDASVWSIQVNASTRDDEEDEDEDDEENYYDEDDCEEEGETDDGLLLDDLCEGMSRISVNGEKKMPKFSGKHTRFVYNSDDEIEGEEECGGGSEVSPGIVRLNGLPTPKGKHLRFPEEEVEEEDN